MFIEPLKKEKENFSSSNCSSSDLSIFVKNVSHHKRQKFVKDHSRVTSVIELVKLEKHLLRIIASSDTLCPRTPLNLASRTHEYIPPFLTPTRLISRGNSRESFSDSSIFRLSNNTSSLNQYIFSSLFPSLPLLVKLQKRVRSSSCFRTWVSGVTVTLGISFSGKAIIVDSLFLNNLLHEDKNGPC